MRSPRRQLFYPASAGSRMHRASRREVSLAFSPTRRKTLSGGWCARVPVCTLFASVHVCECACVSACMCAYKCAPVCLHVFMPACVCGSVHVYLSARVWICEQVCVCVCVCVCVRARVLDGSCNLRGGYSDTEQGCGGLFLLPFI